MHIKGQPLSVTNMDPGLVYLSQLIKFYLLKGHVWWHMPLVLTMAYTLFVRERLLNYALFDSYPDPLPQVKRRCNDPVLGDGYVGCFKASTLTVYDDESLASVTPENCIARCKTNLFAYAALHKGKRCYCGMEYEPAMKAKECKCRKKCRGNTKKRCGGNRHISLYKTYICTDGMKEARTIDGTCNDLNNTAAGSRLYRFGRNVPLKYVYTRPGDLLKPNPRILATTLLERKTFKEVPWLNLFGVAWVQFMVHDWFDHGTPVKENKIKVPLKNDDPLFKKMKGNMKILRTKPDACKTKDDAVPPAYQNDVTHWWDGSQLYGSDDETHARIRSFDQGKLKVDDDGFLPLDPKTKIDVTGFSKNWWVGLSILHNLFTREHNLICDMLLRYHPEWADDDERLFQTSRLINTAQIVQIHTLEWTGAILNTDFIHESQIGQWYGKLSPRITKLLKEMNVTLGANSFPTHQGNPPDYREVPFSLTEEFVAVYRMHSLLPDTIAIRRMETGQLNGNKYSLPEYSFDKARNVFDKNGLANVLFTFGVEKSGQLVLHNYPKALMTLKIPRHQAGGGTLVDLATIDILRDRERGVPRYNQFRRLLNLTIPDTFEKLTNDTVTAAELRAAYNDNIEDVDLLVGSLAEARPEGFGFGDTPFHLFLCMANRRLRTDRFLTIDYKEEYYTKEGLEWVENSTMKNVLLRNFPEVTGLNKALQKVTNAFFVWNK